MARKKDIIVYPSFLKVYKPNKQLISDIVNELMDGVGVSTYAHISGLSRATLYRIINGDYESLTQMTISNLLEPLNDNAKGKFTEKLLNAAGFVQTTSDNQLTIEYDLPVKNDLEKTAEKAILFKLLTEDFTARIDRNNQLFKNTLSIDGIETDFRIETDKYNELGVDRIGFILNYNKYSCETMLCIILGLCDFESLKEKGIKIIFLVTTKERYIELIEKFTDITISEYISIAYLSKDTGDIEEFFDIPTK